MSDNPLLGLRALGQSVWLDDIRRRWLEDGSLARLISDDGLAGVTSNPAIFKKAIVDADDYARAMHERAQAGASASEIYEALVIEDVQRAADLFGDAYERSGGYDGMVSLEVSPHLADDTGATVDEARRLWARLSRANTMIKVPGTKAGLEAITRLTAEGVNVNVTLVFGLARYREVVDAFLQGLEQRVGAGQPIDRVASVASFFLSRIDAKVDARLDELGSADAMALRGQAAVSYARLAYRYYRHDWTCSARWQALARRGARPQRLLWASTSTKDPAYDELKYVDALVAPGTVTTLPMKTLVAYRERGKPAVRIDDGMDAATTLPVRLAAIGIDLEEVAGELEREGLEKFVQPFDALMEVLASVR